LSMRFGGILTLDAQVNTDRIQGHMWDIYSPPHITCILLLIPGEHRSDRRTYVGHLGAGPLRPQPHGSSPPPGVSSVCRCVCVSV
jgi:hypothetical protein